MTKMTLQRLIDARNNELTNYAKAFESFRASYTRLHALDNMLRDRGVDGSHGFGDIPNLILFRHPVANPGIAGMLQTDIQNIVASIEIVDEVAQTDVAAPSPFAARVA